MKRNNISPRVEQILRTVPNLTKELLNHHYRENATEFLLHSLAGENCFNLSKAAYFIDNEDFNCLKGVAGFDKNEKYHNDLIWENPEHFTEHMGNCHFNRKVRNFLMPSPQKQDKDLQSLIHEVSAILSISNPYYYSWDIKHNNKAILIFTPVFDDPDLFDEELLKCLCLLGYCPVF